MDVLQLVQQITKLLKPSELPSACFLLDYCESMHPSVIADWQVLAYNNGVAIMGFVGMGTFYAGMGSALGLIHCLSEQRTFVQAARRLLRSIGNESRSSFFVALVGDRILATDVPRGVLDFVGLASSVLKCC